MDVTWCEIVDRRAEQKKEKLENELNAYRFLETNSELGNQFNEVIAPQNVATYGGFCALATFDRTELKNKVIDNINFRNFLEIVSEVRELMDDFYFRWPILSRRVGGVEKEVEALIPDNQIQAWIESHNKILYARHADQRSATFQCVLQTGSEFDQDVRSMLLRVNLIKHEHNQRAHRKL